VYETSLHTSQTTKNSLIRKDQAVTAVQENGFVYRGNNKKHSNVAICKRILTSNMFVHTVSTTLFMVEYRSLTAMSMSFGNLH